MDQLRVQAGISRTRPRPRELSGAAPVEVCSGAVLPVGEVRKLRCANGEGRGLGAPRGGRAERWLASERYDERPAAIRPKRCAGERLLQHRTLVILCE